MSKTADSAFVFQEILEKTAEHLKVLGHAQRLRILDFLRENGESRVGEIVRRTKISQSVVSFHLNKMRRSGLVVSRRESREVYYWIGTEIAQVVANCLHHKHEQATGLDPLA